MERARNGKQMNNFAEMHQHTTETKILRPWGKWGNVFALVSRRNQPYMRARVTAEPSGSCGAAARAHATLHG